MPRLSTHVLDVWSGRPAPGVSVALYRMEPDGSRIRLAETITNADGRTDAPLLAGEAVRVGRYEIEFGIGAYFQACGAVRDDLAFLDVVPIRFGIADPQGHYHVPLVASPWSYSTYRGS